MPHTPHWKSFIKKASWRGAFWSGNVPFSWEVWGWISSGHQCSRLHCSPAITLTHLSYHHSQISLKRWQQTCHSQRREGWERALLHEGQPHGGGTCKAGREIEEMIGGISGDLPPLFPLWTYVVGYFLLPNQGWLHPILFKQLTECRKQSHSRFLT